MQGNGTRLLRVKAVAEMFDVSVSTIYRAVEAGELQAVKVGTRKGCTLRIPGDALQAFARVIGKAAAGEVGAASNGGAR